MSLTALQSVAAAAQRYLEASARNPFASLVLSRPQRRFIEMVAQGLEVYWCSSNWGGKSFAGALVTVAAARGLTNIGGVKIPKLKTPIRASVLIRSYDQAADSINPAYLKALGTHPHRIGWIDKGLGHIGAIRVKPDDCKSDEDQHWSIIRFISQKNQESNLGGRLDVCHADEPPVQFTWAEARKAGFSGRGFLSFITATPIHASEWGWIESDYEQAHEQPYEGKVRLQTSLYDGIPEVLSRAEADELANHKWKNDPHRKARIYGIPVDVSGACPFNAEHLERWRKRCEPGTPDKILVKSKVDSAVTGRSKVDLAMECFRWSEDKALPDETYYLTADLASGVESPMHDPLCIQLWARRSRRLVLTWNGYVHPYGLGWLAGILTHRYNSPLGAVMHDPERNGGFIDQYLEGLDDALRERGLRPNVARENYRSKPSTWATREGYAQNKESRDNLIGALQRALAADDCDIRDIGVVDCMANCIYDDMGRIVARYGYHDERLICTGRALHVLNVRTAPSPRESRKDSGSMATFRAMYRNTFGRDLPRGGAPEPDGVGLRWRGPRA